MKDKGTCELCGIEAELTKHHLCPASKCKNKYKQIKEDDNNHIWICRQCHDHIHATYDNSWLRDNLNTIEKLLADDKIMSFVSWRKKHPEFDGHSKMSKFNKMKH